MHRGAKSLDVVLVARRRLGSRRSHLGQLVGRGHLCHTWKVLGKYWEATRKVLGQLIGRGHLLSELLTFLRLELALRRACGDIKIGLG